MRNKLIMKYPASWHGDMWREASPVGNGEIGGLIYGGVHKEIIALIHGKLWWDYTDKELPDVSATIAQMRALLKDNKVQEAENVMKNELLRLDYRPQSARPLPLADINILNHNSQGFKKYVREINMENGVASVCWNDKESRFTREFFISRASDIACYKMHVQGDGAYDADFSISLHDLETIGSLTPPANSETICENGYIKFAATAEEDFGAVAFIKHNGTERYQKNAICISNATEIEVFTKVFIKEERHVAWSRAQTELNRSLSYDKELDMHTKLHSKLFHALQFHIGGKDYHLSNEELLLEAYQGEAPKEFIEKMWSFGRYLLICASREGGYPCQLYGLWTGSYNAMWPWNMFNVNIEMIYWQALSGNMPEMLLSVFDYIDARMDHYRINAKQLYNCRGINISSINTPESGLHKGRYIYPHILHWTGAAGWIAQHYFDYYLHTNDITFLKDRAMPFMAEAALFYEDFMTIDDNGYLLSSPSNSPENTPRNVKNDLKSNSEVAVNATMDFAILKELLSNLLLSNTITGLYSEKIEIWQEMLSRIPPYQLNEDGAIKEWMHPFYQDNYEHRHQSHVYPVFPGTEITKHNNPTLYKGFVTAMEKRKVVGLKDQSGWSLTYMSNVFARMGDGDTAMECLHLLSRSNVINNFFTVHNDWRRMGIAICNDYRYAPVQLDGNMGFTATIHEMAIFSTKDEVYVFNAIPSDWEKGSVGPLLTRTNSEVSLTWDKGSKEAKVIVKQLKKDTIFHLIIPSHMHFSDFEGTARQVGLKSGEALEFTLFID